MAGTVSTMAAIVSVDMASTMVAAIGGEADPVPPIFRHLIQEGHSMRLLRHGLMAALLSLAALTPNRAQAYWDKPGFGYAPPPVFLPPPRPVFVPPPPVYYAPPRPLFYAPPVYRAPRAYYGHPRHFYGPPGHARRHFRHW